MSVTNPFEPMSDAVEIAPKPEGREEVEASAKPDNEVPDGSTREVLDWVGDDKDRAKLALTEEEGKGKSHRKGLVRDLKSLLS